MKWFGAGTVSRSCPGCRNETPQGNGPLTGCAWCSAARISNAVQLSKIDPIPLTEGGPCVRCHETTVRLYGPHAVKICPQCQEAEPERKAPQGAPRMAKTVPPPREPRPEPDYEACLF